MGFLSYEAAELLDGHPFPDGDTLGPPIALMLADRAVVFDHWRQRLLLVAHVAPDAYDEGAEALEDLAERLSSPSAPSPDPLPGNRWPTSTRWASPTCPTTATARSSGR